MEAIVPSHRRQCYNRRGRLPVSECPRNAMNVFFAFLAVLVVLAFLLTAVARGAPSSGEGPGPTVTQSLSWSVCMEATRIESAIVEGRLRD